MLALRIEVDGRPFATAGAEDGAFVTFALFCGRPRAGQDGLADIHFSLGGMVEESREHLRWNTPTPTIGTSLTLTIVETDQADPPDERFGPDAASQLGALHSQRQDRYELYLALKAEFDTQTE